MADERLETARSLLLQAVESLTAPGTSRTESVPAVNAAQTTSQGTLPTRQAPRKRTALSRLSASAHFTESVLSERNRLIQYWFPLRYWRPRKPANQKSKKKRLSVWTHDFVCLASTIASKPPSSLETASLIRAGLGKMQLTLFEADDGSDVHAQILRAFPKLQDGGGYELMRVGESGQRSLHVVPPLPDGYSVAYLKEVYSAPGKGIYSTSAGRPDIGPRTPQCCCSSTYCHIHVCVYMCDYIIPMHCRTTLVRVALCVVWRPPYPNFLITSRAVRGQMNTY